MLSFAAVMETYLIIAIDTASKKAEGKQCMNQPTEQVEKPPQFDNWDLIFQTNLRLKKLLESAFMDTSYV